MPQSKLYLPSSAHHYSTTTTTTTTSNRYNKPSRYAKNSTSTKHAYRQLPYSYLTPLDSSSSLSPSSPSSPDTLDSPPAPLLPPLVPQHTYAPQKQLQQQHIPLSATSASLSTSSVSVASSGDLPDYDDDVLPPSTASQGHSLHTPSPPPPPPSQSQSHRSQSFSQHLPPPYHHHPAPQSNFYKLQPSSHHSHTHTQTQYLQRTSSSSSSSTATSLSIPLSSSASVSASPSYPAKPKCKPFVTHPRAYTPEPFRDVRGPFTLYRLCFLSWVAVVTVSLFQLQAYLWPATGTPSPYAHEWYARPALSAILLTPIVMSAFAFIGALWFSFDTRLDDARPMRHRVVFRVVSRGLNNACLTETVRACQRVMRSNSFFPYLIEVVTDAGVYEAPTDADVIQLKVPLSYKTPGGTQFKARALHYACEASTVPGDAWVVHLDEETHPTPSAVKGIAKFVTRCEARGDVKRVGQGSILYGRAWSEYKLLTLMDMRRTGDDFGPFYLQHRLGFSIFGLHGSYVVCRADTEAAVGFDVGPEGSITEDAWWALLAMAKGCRFGWIDGFLAEQSTQSISDFIKQRRRWNYGLIKVARFNPAPWKYRLPFTMVMITWFAAPFFAPFQLAYILTTITHHLPVPMFVRLCTLLIVSLQVWSQFVGWVVNIREGMAVKRRYILPWTVGLIALYPVFQLFELFALLSSFFAGYSKSGRGFHVVEKSATFSSGSANRRATDVSKYDGKEKGSVMV